MVYTKSNKHEKDIKRILVVEGYMDVVALGQFDIHYAVASFGTATTPDHIQFFSDKPAKLFVVLMVIEQDEQLHGVHLKMHFPLFKMDERCALCFYPMAKIQIV